MRVVFWGTYDLGKPRTRILLRGLRENGVDVVECHAEIWSRIEDTSRVTGLSARLAVSLRWMLSYPKLILEYLRAPRHDAVFVGYMGLIDVLVIWPFARLRGVPIVWDAFLSLYDTVVGDRELIGPGHPAARLLFALEWLACRAAGRVILDTLAHAAYFGKAFGVAPERLAAVRVGVEPEHFPARSPQRPVARPDGPTTVLFYGQFIPLHGIDTILEAARLAGEDAIDWVIIGRGQEEERIRALLAKAPLPRLTWIPWVDYRDLKDWIGKADVCLGIFGAGDKAARVIPNKVYQVLSVGAPLITRDSPAIREILNDRMPGVYLVPPADPRALLAALRRFMNDRRALAEDRQGLPLHRALSDRFSPKAVGEELRTQLDALQRTRRGHRPRRQFRQCTGGRPPAK